MLFSLFVGWVWPLIKQDMYRVLVFCGGGIGDAMMTTPMLKALRVNLPDAKIFVAIKQSINKEVFANSQDVDELIDLNSFNSFANMVSDFRVRRFTHSIHNHSCQMTVFYTLPILAGIPNRIGFNRYSKKPTWKTALKAKTLTASIPYKAGLKRRTKMNVEILKLIGIEASDESYRLYTENLAERVPEVVGVHPGSDAGGEIKRWPMDRFVEVALKLADEHQKEVRFFLGPAELALEKAVPVHQRLKVIKPKSVKNLIQELHACTLFISNDSGLSHLAAGHGIPTAVIYGPTKKAEYILPTDYYPVEPEGFDCDTCFKNKKCDNASACLTSISLEKVIAAIEPQLTMTHEQQTS